MSKPKILLLADDMRLPSGVATMAKEFVLGTVDKYDWIQLGSALNPSQQGQMINISEDVKKITGVDDASVRIVPWKGYGNPNILRQLMDLESPDLILHFTDPRYWIWLYEMEHEVRQQCPIMFYTIWDNLPDPLYNRSYYESCDSIACISKQTYGIVKRLTKLTDKASWKPHEDWQVSYVPHGINSDMYKPVSTQNLELKRKILGDKDYEFILFWSNRNIKRKQPADVINSFKIFCDGLTKEESDKCVLVMHTNPLDKNGTDLYAVKEAICPDYDVKFSTAKLSQEELNDLYNIADVTINIAGNEGFGLTTAESIMAGTPVILTVTGGLQDQCGFKAHFEADEFTAEDYVIIGSLHDKNLFQNGIHTLEYGEWVEPIWPAVSTLIGSIKTPYIYDDKVDVTEVALAIKKWHIRSAEERKERGLKGREWMLTTGGLSAENMSNQMSNMIDTTIKNWQPKERYKLHKIQ